MAKAYSDDLRARVAASVVSGRTCRETAALFAVSVASVVKWSQRLRATGSAAAMAVGRREHLGPREWRRRRPHIPTENYPASVAAPTARDRATYS